MVGGLCTLDMNVSMYACFMFYNRLKIRPRIVTGYGCGRPDAVMLQAARLTDPALRRCGKMAAERFAAEHYGIGGHYRAH